MIGSKLAHYQITAHLGSGGMGDVYQAMDAKLGRSVAIKLLPESFAHDVERSARLEREARTLALLNHPRIAAVYGLEESGDRFAPDGTLMAVPIIVNAGTLEPGKPVPLFHTRIVGGGTDINLGVQFDASRDGRFLINTLLEDVGAAPITLLQNWNPK